MFFPRSSSYTDTDSEDEDETLRAIRVMLQFNICTTSVIKTLSNAFWCLEYWIIIVLKLLICPFYVQSRRLQEQSN